MMDKRTEPMTPIITILPGRQKRLKTGHPWIYSNEIAMTAEARALPPGSVVSVKGNDGVFHGLAHFNPHALISARIITRRDDAILDAAFFEDRLRRALDLRSRFFTAPYYRLVHAEADGLPGLIVDRYGDTIVLQFNAAGMDRARADVLAAVNSVLSPRRCVIRNDSPAREREGLTLGVEIIGETETPGDGTCEIEENGVRFVTDLQQGQKTGWFFDQRENRRFVASLSNGRRVLDCYCHSGGFGVQAAVSGAADVTMVDSSALALDMAMQSAALNNVSAQCSTIKADVFEELARRAKAGETYDVVIADPPSFVKSKKDQHSGERGYRKLARLAAALVAPGGMLFIASCSHNVAPDPFAKLVANGVRDARRTGRILRASGADVDHPVHPSLPESAYLKALTLQLD
ncbi:MAG: class I SAM-dependent rRNA methyltransferase [Rhodospirillaceae bacterium]|nr:class I SAM-dependent rRNA methyltransferase [Rhodospirillaceae bacterium]MBT5667285.1 class I SAM-dependent rRNA methyltransferase [Rhodospirillaceae bacterium]MBT5812191.1 class I SAM-dependent rRNA methyltransferase [Rhodospirillaceae bacterium]